MKRTLTVGLVAALAFVSAACGDDDETSSTDTTPGVTDNGTTPGTTPEGAGETTLVTTADTPVATEVPATPVTEPTTPATEAEDVPQRIVSLSPTHTEILFAIGAGDQVIAVDSLSNHPEEASAVLTDLSAFEPNVEAISGYEPDLVILSNEGPIVDQLAKIDIETWIGPAPATVDDAYAQIEQLGALTGHVGDAAEVVSNMEADIAELTSDLPAPQRPLTFYHELDDTYYSATSNTFIGSIYSMFGLRNIADQVEGDSGGYPQLNAEFIVSESPDMIFLADTVCCAQTAEAVAARDGWDTIAAVQNGNVIEMNDDIASRWGPRIVDYVRQVRTAFEDAAATQPASFRSVLPNRPNRRDRADSTGQNGVASGR
ncbi:hypothetical protein BH20ACT4_BH20ACT4_12250 [soil metagenome]